MCEEFTTLDYATMKVGITCAFARKFDMSIADTVELFQSNGIYEFLDEGGDQFITKMYGYMANYIARRLGMPMREPHLTV